MAYNLHIVKTTDFIRVDASGKTDFERSYKVLAGVARACVERGIDHALLDIRDLEGQLTTTELYSLARAFHEMGFRKNHRLAVLHRYRADRAELFATFAADHGWDVRGFENYEEAMEWFSTALPLE